MRVSFATPTFFYRHGKLTRWSFYEHTVETENVRSVNLLLCQPLRTWGMALLNATRMRSWLGSEQSSRAGLQLSRESRNLMTLPHNGFHGDECSRPTCMLCFSISPPKKEIAFSARYTLWYIEWKKFQIKVKLNWNANAMCTLWLVSEG